MSRPFLKSLIIFSVENAYWLTLAINAQGSASMVSRLREITVEVTQATADAAVLGRAPPPDALMADANRKAVIPAKAGISLSGGCHVPRERSEPALVWRREAAKRLKTRYHEPESSPKKRLSGKGRGPVGGRC